MPEIDGCRIQSPAWGMIQVRYSPDPSAVSAHVDVFCRQLPNVVPETVMGRMFLDVPSRSRIMFGTRLQTDPGSFDWGFDRFEVWGRLFQAELPNVFRPVK
jgi:hypothetical protein